MVKKANNMESIISTNDNDAVDISKYIGFLYSCETTSYTLKKRLIDINELVKQVLDMSEDDKDKLVGNNIVDSHSRYIRKINIVNVGILVAMFLVFASIIAGILAIRTMTVSKYAYITFFIIVILCTILFASMLISRKRSSIKSERLDSKANKYRLIDTLTLKLLTEEKDEVNERLELISNELESIYNNININCLKSNYNGLIPISVIYGYFDTGRCNTLESAIVLFNKEKENGIITLDINELSKNLNNTNQSMYYVKLAIEVCESQLESLMYNNGRMMDSISQLYDEDLSETDIRKEIAIIKKQTTNRPYYYGITKDIMTSRL